MTCRWTSTTTPRALVGRHHDACPDPACPGCQPCTEPHCRVCGRRHAEGACAECVGEARETLREITRMCSDLPAEVAHRGVEGEAMNLLGPAADPEARGHVEASIAAGRLPADYLDTADSDSHPLLVLGTWDMIWRDALDHDEPTERLTVVTAAAYLDVQLTYMADFPHVPFEDFVRDLRACVSHLEGVLHDGEQVETGAPCMTCRVPLRLVRGESADHWVCPRCHQQSTEAQYRYAVMHLHRQEAEWLTDREMELRTGVKAGTVREWARRGHVDKRLDSGRVVFRVEQVLERSGIAV